MGGQPSDRKRGDKYYDHETERLLVEINCGGQCVL